MASPRPATSVDCRECAKESSSARAALVVGLLLVGLALRLAYAYNLPLGPDEDILFSEAQEISIVPGNFHLPLVADGGRHVALVVWICAAANWLAAGSLFGIRCVFVLLHGAGLYGLFLLARHLFGYRAAALALAFAVVDRFWVTSSPQILEPASFFLAPWVLLTAYQCVHRPWRGSWLVLGVLLAAANFYYEISLLLGLPVAFVILASRAGRRTLRTPGPYLAAAVGLSVVVLVQIWNVRHGQGGSLRYVLGVLDYRSIVAFSPRVLLLYLADAILPFRDASILALQSGDEFYAPIHISCHWLAGLFYLAGVAWSLRFPLDRGVVFMLAAFLSVAVPISLVPPRELWCNIHYAGLSVVPAVVLAGWFADRILARRAGQIVVALVLAGLAVSIVLFLRGPKWGYPSLGKEIEFVGKVYYYAQRHAGDEGGMTDEDRNIIRRLTDEMEKTHPDSLVVQHMRSQFAADAEDKIEAMRQAKRIDPHAPLTALLEAGRMQDAGDLAGARDRLKAALERHPGMPVLLQTLTEIECQLGEYDEAAKHAEQTVRERPGYADFYEMLVFIYDAQGRPHEAQRAFDLYRYWSRRLPSDAHLTIAVGFVNRGMFDKALPYANEALRLAPQSTTAKFFLAVALAGVGELDRAERLFEDIPPSDAGYAGAREYIESIREARQAIRDDATNPPPSDAGNR